MSDDMWHMGTREIEQEVRGMVKLGLAVVALGILFWIAVIAGVVALIVHFA